MSLQPGGALVHLAVSEPLPIEAAAGDEFTLTVRASCAAGRRACASRSAAPMRP